MTLEEFKQKLTSVSEVTFLKPDGTTIPKHFHITEVGQTNKKFIDCGGTIYQEQAIVMQLWESIDFWHRLEPSKLNTIIELSEKKLGIGNHEIEIEYQEETIGKFGVVFENGVFKLTSKQTACLASDQCGIPALEGIKENGQLRCTPGGGCC
jgi:hypothetical protein